MDSIVVQQMCNAWRKKQKQNFILTDEGLFYFWESELHVEWFIHLNVNYIPWRPTTFFFFFQASSWFKVWVFLCYKTTNQYDPYYCAKGLARCE